MERCQEMGIPIVNYQWLVELYLGLKNSANAVPNENYGPIPGMTADTNTTPYAIEHYSEQCKQLLCMCFSCNRPNQLTLFVLTSEPQL